MSNASARPQGASWVSPYIIVKDVDKAIKFYKDAFHFIVKNSAPSEDGCTMHAELLYKDQLLMFGKEGMYGSTSHTPASSGVESPINLYIYCEDVDALYRHAVEAGAKSQAAPDNMFWGDRMCRLLDLDGYVWCFATHLGEAKI